MGSHGSSASRIPTELVERLEVADRGSHVLDAEIWCARNGYTFVQWDGAGCVYRERPESSIRHIRHSDIAPVTTSLDAALALAERALPGCEVYGALNQRRSDPERAWIEVSLPGRTPEVAKARTPCLALCAAILKVTTANSVGTQGEARSEPS